MGFGWSHLPRRLSSQNHHFRGRWSAWVSYQHKIPWLSERTRFLRKLRKALPNSAPSEILSKLRLFWWDLKFLSELHCHEHSSRSSSTSWLRRCLGHRNITANILSKAVGKSLMCLNSILFVVMDSCSFWPWTADALPRGWDQTCRCRALNQSGILTQYLYTQSEWLNTCTYLIRLQFLSSRLSDNQGLQVTFVLNLHTN